MSEGAIRYQGWRPDKVAPRNFAAEWLSDAQIAYALQRIAHRAAFQHAITAAKLTREKRVKRGAR